VTRQATQSAQRHCIQEDFFQRRRWLIAMCFLPTPWVVAAITFFALGFSRWLHSSIGVGGELGCYLGGAFYDWTGS
jgi:hypothetical protein